MINSPKTHRRDGEESQGTAVAFQQADAFFSFHEVVGVGRKWASADIDHHHRQLEEGGRLNFKSG
jgi:hypothetical protein